jgi:hypothetical protein
MRSDSGGSHRTLGLHFDPKLARLADHYAKRGCPAGSRGQPYPLDVGHNGHQAPVGAMFENFTTAFGSWLWTPAELVATRIVAVDART